MSQSMEVEVSKIWNIIYIWEVMQPEIRFPLEFRRDWKEVWVFSLK